MSGNDKPDVRAGKFNNEALKSHVIRTCNIIELQLENLLTILSTGEQFYEPWKIQKNIVERINKIRDELDIIVEKTSL